MKNLKKGLKDGKVIKGFKIMQSKYDREHMKEFKKHMKRNKKTGEWSVRFNKDQEEFNSELTIKILPWIFLGYV